MQHRQAIDQNEFRQIAIFQLKKNYGRSGDAAGDGEGLTSGLFDPGGGGAGALSGVTVRLGSGSAGAFRLALALVFSLVLLLAVGLGTSIGAGETSAFALAFAFAFAFAAGIVTPPAGMPSSPLPVGGGLGCTGRLFGSATNEGCWFAFEFMGGVGLRVKA